MNPASCLPLAAGREFTQPRVHSLGRALYNDQTMNGCPEAEFLGSVSLKEHNVSRFKDRDGNYHRGRERERGLEMSNQIRRFGRRRRIIKMTAAAAAAAEVQPAMIVNHRKDTEGARNNGDDASPVHCMSICCFFVLQTLSYLSLFLVITAVGTGFCLGNLTNHACRLILHRFIT